MFGEIVIRTFVIARAVAGVMVGEPSSETVVLQLHAPLVNAGTCPAAQARDPRVSASTPSAKLE
ncbi:MAG TPA: hypothetical protein EYM69_08870 [Dehalococcoidia bacterium]|nr:hypothetical protein [Dehalococcoidia bacterium]